jgi:hypothetical protein
LFVFRKKIDKTIVKALIRFDLLWFGISIVIPAMLNFLTVGLFYFNAFGNSELKTSIIFLPYTAIELFFVYRKCKRLIKDKDMKMSAKV